MTVPLVPGGIEYGSITTAPPAPPADTAGPALTGGPAVSTRPGGREPLHRSAAPMHKRGLPGLAAWAAVGALTVLSLILGSYHLGGRSLWLDEGFTWLTADLPTGQIFHVARFQGYHLVPYYLLVHAFIRLFGDGPVAMRAPSVLAGAAAVPLLYLLVCRLGGRLAGVYASVLFVVSEPMIFWQQNARDYAFVVLLAVASMLAAVVGLQTGKLWPFAVWMVVTAAGCYTHPEMLLMLPPQILVLILWSRTWRLRATIAAITLVGALASLPALLNAAHSSVYQTTDLLPPAVGSATEISTFLASAAGTGAPVRTVDHALLFLTFALVVLGVAVVGSDLVERGCTWSNLGLGLGLAWLILPPVLSWLVSESGHPDFIDRYLMISLPAASVVLALVLVRLRPRVLGLFGLAYLTIFRFGVLVPSYHYPLDDYSDASKLVLASARPGDCITFSSNQGRVLWDYYSAGRSGAPVQVLPFAVNGGPQLILAFNSLPLSEITNLQQRQFVAQVALGCQRIWLYQSHAGSPTGSANSRALAASLDALQHNLGLYYQPAHEEIFTGVAVTVWDRVHKP